MVRPRAISPWAPTPASRPNSRTPEANIGQPIDLTWIFARPFSGQAAVHPHLDKHLEAGRTVIYNIGLGGSAPVKRYSDVFSGLLDSTLRAVAKGLASRDQSRILVSFSQEPETSRARTAYGEAPDFKRAWDWWVRLLREEGFTGRTILVSGIVGSEEFWNTWYPDPDNVDIVGSDEFNWGGDPVSSFYSEFAGPESKLDSQTKDPGVPWIASSWGVSQDKRDAIRSQVLRDAVPVAKAWRDEAISPLLGIVYWDRNTEGTAKSDFILSPGTYAAFGELVSAFADGGEPVTPVPDPIEW
jgi:hypothetical protein